MARPNMSATIPRSLPLTSAWRTRRWKRWRRRSQHDCAASSSSARWGRSGADGEPRHIPIQQRHGRQLAWQDRVRARTTSLPGAASPRVGVPPHPQSWAEPATRGQVYPPCLCRRGGERRSRAMSEPLLSVRGVKSFYGSIMALKGVALDVCEGEIVTLIGANGAGKSTLMMTIFGNPRAREGRIVYAGRDITDLPTHEIARLRIAQSPEGRRIFPRMSVRENLQMGAEIDEGAHFAEDLAKVCALFPVLARRLDQRGGTLSGGEQQMLAIARALMSRPRLLLLDEPSLGLAPLIVKP